MYPAKFKDYQEKIEPYVNAYLKKVGNRGISSINIQKQAIGMPEHLTPPPKQTYVAPLGPRGDGGGRPRPDKPGGFTDPGKGSYGPHKADGGLIDIPLSGRSRYI